jgi:hypothetical protein
MSKGVQSTSEVNTASLESLADYIYSTPIAALSAAFKESNLHK